MNIVTVVIPLAASLLYFLLFTFSLRVKRKMNRIFSVYLLAMGLWTFSSFMWHADFPVIGDPRWLQVSLFFGTSYAPLLYYFVVTFLGLDTKPIFRGSVWAMFGLLPVVLIGYIRGDHVRVTRLARGQFDVQFGSLVYPVWMVAGLGLIACFVLLVWASLKTKDDRNQRNRLHYLTFSNALILAGSFVNISPQLRSYSFDHLFNVMSAFLMAYAIYRYQLLDLSFVIRKGLSYSILTAGIAATYLLTIFLFERLARTVLGYGAYLIPVLVAVVAALALQPLGGRIQSWVDRLFFREKYDAQQMLHRLSRTTSSILDLDVLSEMLLEEVTTTMHIAGACILLAEQATGEFSLVAQRGLDQDMAVLRLRRDHPLPRWLAREGKVLTTHEIGMLPQFKGLREEEAEDLKRLGAELFVPLLVKGDLVGLIAFGPRLSEEAYSQDEHITLTTLANQAAVAIENARLYQETVRRLKETEALAAVTTVLTYSLDLDQVLQSIVDSATRLIPRSTSGMIHLANEELGKLIPWATSPEVHIREELEMPIGEGIAGLVTQEKRLINVPNVEKDPRFLTMGVASSYKSLLTAPLMVDGDCIGTLSLNSSQVGAFNADDERLLTTLAAQATIAVRNARLHQEVQRRVEELVFLNQVGRTAASSLDLEQVLTTVMEETVLMLKTEAGSILLLDVESGELVFEAAVGPRAKEIKGLRLPLGQGIAGWVAQEGQPLLVPDAGKDPRFYPGVDGASGFATRSVLAVPLEVKGTVIGVIEAVNKTEGDLDQLDVELLSAMAQSAAIAIENAQLYEAIQQELTERKRAEEALREERASLARRVEERTAELSVANAELARAVHLKDEFLATMSHELRTPLNAILGLSEALQEQVYGPLNERQLKSLRGIEESGHHLLALINDILDVSKIEAGKLELEVGPVSVVSVCQASLRLIKQAAHKKQLRVSSTFDRAVTTLEADGRRLKQILVNLLSNAVKFTPEGGTIGLEVVSDDECQVVHFAVWDTGIGISEEDMGRLFQPFVQLDSSLSRQYTGTGLGLSLVYRLTEMHGGSVSVESEVGQGSRFTVSLPWHPADARLRTIDRRPRTADEGPLTVSQQPPAIVLLAEDNEESINTLTDYLGAKGYRVVVARDGAEAIERARKERPDMILMDIQMPGMDGLEATRRLRADADLGTIPIIALTALAMPGDRERCLAAGVNEYLSKPVSLKGLVKAMEARLSRNQIGRENLT
jgi:signal transduction histidine kinase/CheY-like chemotaxis protein